jgi:formate/nitrite transporter
MYGSGLLSGETSYIAEQASKIAAGKMSLSVSEAFVRGILCNILVCVAVWMSYSAKDTAGKIVAILFPISAFVALGFEHSVANMYLLPVGLIAGAEGTWIDVLVNLAPVTLGNIIGGGVCIALLYGAVYNKKK